jgi:splicing factor 3A subunit 3
MASTLLEQTREAHEECERLERFIVADLKTEAITHKQRLRQGHRVNRALDAIAANAKRLRATYADADSARAEELASFGTLDTNIVASDPNDDPNDAATRDAGTAFSSFYRRLEETRAYHASRPGMFAPPPDAFTRTFESDVPLTFSGEESNGRFLDLHAHHAAFRNAPFGDPSVPYVAFLADVGVSQMRAIPRARKFGDAYSAYLESLRAYLAGFLEKVAPLRFSSHKREEAPTTKKTSSTRRGAPGNASGGRTEAFLLSGARRLNTRTRPPIPGTTPYCPSGPFWKSCAALRRWRKCRAGFAATPRR